MQATGANLVSGGDLAGLDNKAELKQKIKLNFAAMKLPDLDVGRSNTDPFCVLFEFKGGRKVRVGVTEIISDSQNPMWV